MTYSFLDSRQLAVSLAGSFRHVAAVRFGRHLAADRLNRNLDRKKTI